MLLLIAIAAGLGSTPAPIVDCPDGCPKIALVHPESTAIKPFYMTVFEITWSDYLRSVHEAGCTAPVNEDSRYLDVDVTVDGFADSYPVTGVSPLDFNCYISWLNRKSGHNYRLPSSKEWLEAARYAPAKPGYLTKSPGEPLRDARSAVNRLTVHPTGLGDPSPDGIYDLEGNAGEVLSDRRMGDRSLCAELGYRSCLQLGLTGLYLLRRTEHGFIPADYKEMNWINESTPQAFAGFRLVRN